MNLPPAHRRTIAASIDRLRQLSQQDVQPCWRYLSQANMADKSPNQLPPRSHWPKVSINNRGHISWEKGQTTLWLCQQFCWPEQLHQYPLAGLSIKLALRWWADLAEIFVNGSLIQTGDLFDCYTRILLGEALIPDQTVEVILKLVSPGHDDGALVTSRLIFESPQTNLPEPGFIADEMFVLNSYLSQFFPQHLPTLEHALNRLNWECLPDRTLFNQSLIHLRTDLAFLSPWIKERTIHCLGHAHLDLAWLWPISNTWEAAERTFQSVLQLQDEFPQLTYTHSSPALFAWLEAHRPELFAAIQQKVKAGTWAIDAGLWVEPELNLIGGEAIIRQLLYGQRYCLEKFGQVSEIAWLPDSFGFSWQLPQLLTLGGVRYFATQKLHWNDTNAFPHHWFQWQGLDGTKILSLTLPPIGSDIDPAVIVPYAVEWEAITHYQDSLWLPGVGDHGGGPTRDMLQQAQRWANSPFFPQLVFNQVRTFIQCLEKQPELHSSHSLAIAADPPSNHNLPLWQDELYLELHRGCYTTHADQKRYNRQCEDALYQAELFSSIALILTQTPYPKAELETAWKQVLLNQFHDILPGSSIPEVFEDANRAWETSLQISHKIRQTALQSIASFLSLPARPNPKSIPIIIFNSLNWARSEVVSINLSSLPKSNYAWQVHDGSGQPITQQLSNPLQPFLQPTDQSEITQDQLLFMAEDIPSIGYRLFWLSPSYQNTEPLAEIPAEWILHNSYLKITIDSRNGDIASCFDLQQDREILSHPGNHLQAFQDAHQYWDAWNIAPDYADHPLPDFQLTHMQWLDYGPIRQRLRTTRQLNQSTFIQDYILDSQSSVLKIETFVDWQEDHTLVKALFPINFEADYATYEIPFGAIKRSTQSLTPETTAKWEVPALKWADLSQTNYGISLLTAGKHGFSATPCQLSLTLLKAPTWPDPTADRGTHHFVYALYAHQHQWQEAKTVRLGLALNQSLISHIPYYSEEFNHNFYTEEMTTSSAPNWSSSFLDIGDNSLVLSAFKIAEDSEPASNSKLNFILRCYESEGKTCTAKFNGLIQGKLTTLSNCLEQPDSATVEVADSEPDSIVKPWKVMSYNMAAS